MILGHTSVASNIRLLQFLNHEHAAHTISLDLTAGIFFNRLSVEEPRNFRSWVAVNFAHKLGITVEKLLDVVKRLREEWSRINLLDFSITNSSACSLIIAQMAFIGTSISNIGINNFKTNEFTIAEEVAP